MSKGLRIKVEPLDGPSAEPAQCRLLSVDCTAFVLRATFEDSGSKSAYDYFWRAFANCDKQRVTIMNGRTLVEQRTAVITQIETTFDGGLTHSIEFRPILTPKDDLNTALCWFPHRPFAA